jgi:hypothetical protein
MPAVETEGASVDVYTHYEVAEIGTRRSKQTRRRSSCLMASTVEISPADLLARDPTGESQSIEAHRDLANFTLQHQAEIGQCD